MTKFSASQQSQLAQIGAFLRDHREKQEKSLEDIAMRTYIRPQLLGGLETGNPDVLPEPIFVQGFIRRYAEVLGFNGVELSQQFTVDSIPSTPRPARSAPPTDSPTTRLTRIVPSQPAVSQALASPVPAVSTDPSLKLEQPAEVDLVAEVSDLEKADTPYVEEPALAADLSQSAASAPQPPEPIPRPIEETTPQPFEPASQPAEPAFMTSEPTFVTVDDVFLTQVPSAPEFLIGGSATETVAHDRAYDSEQVDVQLQARPSDTFDEITAAISSEVSPSVLNSSTSGTASFGDDIHSNETINETDPADTDGDHIHLDQDPSPAPSDDFAPPSQVDAQADARSPEVFTPQTATPVLTPVSAIAAEGVDNSRSRSTLVPLIIGGLAIIAAGAAVLFALFGGDRQPSIADRPDAVEQVAEGTSADPTLEAVPDEAAYQPPISTAPVYVEATATSEAWVSIIADGNPTPIFEGTLLPGESQVWEAQEELSIYAGDPGALQLSANGAEATVMGEPGLPAEKIFP